MSAFIRLEGLTKHFDEFVAVDGVDLEIREGEFFSETAARPFRPGLDGPGLRHQPPKPNPTTLVPFASAPARLQLRVLAPGPSHPLGPGASFSGRSRARIGPCTPWIPRT